MVYQVTHSEDSSPLVATYLERIPIHNMDLLTVRKIRDIIALLDQDVQHLVDLSAALTGEKALDLCTWLNTGGDETMLTNLAKGTA